MIRPEIEQIILSLEKNINNWGIERYRERYRDSDALCYYSDVLCYFVRHKECHISIKLKQGLFQRLSLWHFFCGGYCVYLNPQEKKAIKKRAVKLVKRDLNRVKQGELRNQQKHLNISSQCLIDKENYK